MGNNRDALLKGTNSSNRLSSSNTFTEVLFDVNPFELKAVSRDTSTSVNSINGSVVNTYANNSTDLSVTTLSVLARTGLSGNLFQGTLSMAFQGASITGLESEFDTAFKTYINSL
jgi:hypothetical protein